MRLCSMPAALLLYEPAVCVLISATEDLQMGKEWLNVQQLTSLCRAVDLQLPCLLNLNAD